MKQRTEKERIECEKMKEAMGNWIASNNFTLFRTATYLHPINVYVQKANRDAAYFTRLLSREILGKHKVDRQFRILTHQSIEHDLAGSID